MQTVTNNPLFAREHTAFDTGINGSVLKRYFTVFNLGKREAEISISITAIDDISEPLQNWCSLRPNPVVLNPGESEEVVLVFNIPQQAVPDIYKYEVLFEAPEQYPEKFFRCVQQLAISRVDREPEWGESPQFSVNPPNSSSKPYSIEPEGETEIVVTVKNQSTLVDSFELSCPDLESDWYTVQYPERDLKLPGLITETDALKLNPGKEGEIILTIHPPSLTLAGNYVRTIQLTSSNRKDLVLLDVLYLNIISNDRLEGDISPQLKTLPQETGEFTLKVVNLGNITRNLDLNVEDNKGMFAYKLNNKQLPLPPGQTESLTLTAKPRWFMGWRRPLRGKGLESRFELVADNTYDIVLPETNKPPVVPKNLARGTIILAPRPRWQLIALIVLATSAVGALIFAIWWWVFRLPPAPRIREFNATKTMIADEREIVYLDWRIKNPQQVSKVGFITRGSGDELDETYESFKNCTVDDLESCIPQRFTEFCQISDRQIQCSKLPMNVLDPGKYTFELQIYPKSARKLLRKRDSDEVFDTEASDTITIAPPPIPKISRNTGLLIEKNTYEKPSSEAVKLNWEVSQFSRLKKLNISSRDSEGKNRTYSYTYSEKTGELVPVNSQQQGKLQCSRIEQDAKVCNWSIKVNDLELGDRNFVVETYATVDSEEPSDTIEAKNTVSIEAQPLPVIKQFISDKNEIGRDEPIILNWQIENFQQIDSIAIKALADDGSSTELKRYQYPTEIAEFCNIPEQAEELKCSSELTTSLPAGSYQLQMLVEPEIESTEAITAQTDKITVKPQPFDIESFTIDGERVERGKTYLYPKLGNKPTKIDLGWSIAGEPENLKVELLPIGEQELSGSVPYYLQSDRETITLQVTNELGEQKTQTLQVQSYESNSSTSPLNNRLPSTKSTVPVPPTTSSTDSKLPSPPNELNLEISPIPESPTKLKPIEIAPKAD